GDPGKERRYDQAGKDPELEIPVPDKDRADKGIRIVSFPKGKDSGNDYTPKKEEQENRIRCARDLVECEGRKEEDQCSDKECRPGKVQGFLFNLPSSRAKAVPAHQKCENDDRDVEEEDPPP